MNIICILQCFICIKLFLSTDHHKCSCFLCPRYQFCIVLLLLDIRPLVAAMDLEWRVDDESEATFIEDEDCMIDSFFEQERCGICMDIVIDRGVLDCCEHWFCFVCIDNWATITNLCPICRKEFQLITCLPVYDTIQSIRSEEHPLSGSDDWFIQEKNNALSFPSYYISEDAVKCLENDGCKLRSGLQATEEGLCIDTSIACDSCDMWYHAYCVGFNPEFTSGNSWLCPRCIASEVQQMSGAVSLQGPGKDSIPQISEIGWTVEPSFSGKLSVSVADDGETAVVVSMIEEKQKTDCKISVLDRLDSKTEQVVTTFSSYSEFLNSETNVHLKDDSCMQISHNDLIFSGLYTTASDVDNSSEYFFDISPEIIDFESVDDSKKATVSSISQDSAAIKPWDDITEPSSQPSTLLENPLSLCYSESSGDGKHVNTLEITSDSAPNSSFMTCSTSEGKNESDKKSNEKTYLGFGDFSSSSADNMVASCHNDMVVDMTHNDREASKSAEVPKLSQSNIMNAGVVNDYIRKRELEAEYPVKKLKSDGKSKILPPESLSSLSSLDGFQVCRSNSRGASLGRAKQEEAEAPDIMSIIQESDGTSHITTEIKAANNSIDKKDNTFGLRVKKIMRRVEKKKESSVLAQELGKEIREVVQQKALKDFGKNNDFDEKLLAAFRAATARSKTELTDRSEMAKKPLVVKGKKRENLTKKIYGTGSGRRRHAWVRDLEIEFWKHRCRRKQPEKVETLQSVLELLKKATNPNWNSSTEQISEKEATDSVLSRVYIADASLFPRKDDIKPFSAFAEGSQFDIHNLNQENSSKIASKEPLIYENNSRKNSILNSKSSLQLTANSCDSIGKKIHAPCYPGKASNQNANSGGAAIRSSASNCFKVSMPTSKEHNCSSDVKSDKRKWALEVLARKTSSTNINANKGQDDNDSLKDKYPLLAQLSPDMRPVVASSPHNKIPLSVRQAQLYRITEYYLRRTNLPFIYRTAATELAVADAVNIEKEISERSNSKLVYVNLCSQAVSQNTIKTKSAETNVSNSPMITSKAANEVVEDTNSDSGTGNKEEPADRIVSNSAKYTSKDDSEVAEETISDPKTGGWSNVEEALKMAGLYSDSPPCSPYSATKDPNEYNAVQENVEEECLNCDADGNVIDRKPDTSICLNPGNVAPVYDCVNLVVKPSFDFSNSLRQTKEIERENSKDERRMDDCLPITIPERRTFNEPSLEECDRNDKESQMNQTSNGAVEVLKKPLEASEANSSKFGVKEKCVLKDETVFDTKSCISGSAGDLTPLDQSSAGRDPETHSRVINPVISDFIPIEETAKQTTDESELIIAASKKVEAYIKEHIRPLCKSGVITVEQYRWAAGKTLDKVMKFHQKAKNANFLIREGEKVKKLAEQYVEASQRKEMR